MCGTFTFNISNGSTLADTLIKWWKTIIMETLSSSRIVIGKIENYTLELIHASSRIVIREEKIK